MFRVMLAGVFAIGVCGAAQAADSFTMEHGEPQNLAKFIRGFNSVNVRIQPGSERCGISDATYYQGKLRDALKTVGLEEKSDALTGAYLFIWGQAFGVAGQQCAMFSSLRLGSDVSAAAVEFKTRQEADGTVVEQLKTVQGTFPAAFFITSKLGVKMERSAAAEQDKIIEELVADFKAARSTASGSQ